MTGSSVTGLGLKSSKVDFSFKVNEEKNIPDALELLYKKLLNCKLKIITLISFH